jgi:hypothetical protein
VRLSTGIWLVTALATAGVCYALTYVACELFYLSYVNYIVNDGLCFAALSAGLIPLALVLFFGTMAQSAVLDATRPEVRRY